MPTLAITGGEVLRPDLSVECADVLVDRGAGEITAVVAPGEADVPDDTFDASGDLVIPGLVNVHTHVAMTLLRGVADDKPLDAWLQEDIWPLEAAMEPADVRAGARLGCLELIRSGTTAFADMYFHVEAIADAVAESGLRAVLGHTAITAGKDADAGAADVQESLDVARRLDGRADGRIRTTVQPHSLTTVDGEALAELAEGARDLGRPLHYHANETADEVAPIVGDEEQRPLSYAADHGALEPGDWIAHGVHLDDEEIKLLAERDVAVAHCPAANMKLASGMAPIQRCLDAGVTVALGTDGPASNNDLDLLGELSDAALLGKLAADDAAAVDAPTALRMATRNGARALGIDAGRIEPGAAADLAVIDRSAAHLSPGHDPVSDLVYAARGSDVRHTICDGEVLMRDREVVALDGSAVRQKARERAAALVERAGD
jgi:5-methylthioadenosine/S-adenosylhomocysteine deaminase